MGTSQEQHNLQSKQRLRVEIHKQVEAFLHNGGRIEVLNDRPDLHNFRQVRHWPAATEMAFAAGAFAES